MGAGTGMHLQRTDTISHLDIKPRYHQARSHPRPRQTHVDTLSPRWVAGTARWLQPSDPMATSPVATDPATSQWIADPLKYSPHSQGPQRLVHSATRPMVRKRQ